MNSLDLNATHFVTQDATTRIVDVASLRKQCRIDHQVEDDKLLEWCDAATELLEADTLLLLRPIEGEMRVDRFPCTGEPLYVERLPVGAIDAIRYIDVAGEEQTWSSENYIAGMHSMPPRIVPAFGKSWPAIRHQPEAVRVAFSGGYAEGTAPKLAQQAVQLLVGYWFENRAIAGELPTDDAFRKTWSTFTQRLGWSGI